MQPSSEWRLTTARGIPYRVLSRGGGFSKEEANASETYVVEARHLLAFALESLPRPLLFLGQLIYPRSRRLPGLSTLTTKNVKWEAFDSGLPVDPFGGDSSAPDDTYQDYVKVTIEYTTNPNNDGDETDPDDPRTILEISANASGTFLASPIRGNAEWELEGYDLGEAQFAHDLAGEEFDGKQEVKEMDVPQTIRQPEVEWSVRWPQIPYEFWTDKLVTRLRDKLGKLNDSKMSLFHDAPVETVMFLSWSMKQSYTWRDGEAGKSPVEVDMRFLEKNFKDVKGNQVTHNHMYRPGKGWTILLIDDERLYDTTDLDKIFTG